MYSACSLTVTGSWLWVEWKSFWTTGALLEFSSCRHTIKQSLYSTRTKLLVVICAKWPDRCQDSDTFVLPRTFQLATHHVSRVGGIKCLIWGRGLVLWWTTAQKHTIHTFNDSQKHETRCMAFHLMESFANNNKKKRANTHWNQQQWTEVKLSHSQRYLLSKYFGFAFAVEGNDSSNDGYEYNDPYDGSNDDPCSRPPLWKTGLWKNIINMSNTIRPDYRWHERPLSLNNAAF